jgi:isopenicillin N synthase-like dioxygenase
MPEIPLIDIGPLLRGETGDSVQAVARELRRTCEGTGFFSVIGHGVPKSAISDLRSNAYAFFDSSLEEKKRVARPRPEQNRGFIGSGGETLARLGGRETPPDIKEVFTIGPFDFAADDYHSCTSAYPSFAPNLWPACAPELEPAMKTYWTFVEHLAKAIARGFAIALDLDPRYFDPLIDRNTSQLRIIYYPPPGAAPEPGQLRAGEHTDLGMMTILTNDNDIGGLQVRRRDGDWIDVPVNDDAFVVNIGDLMMRWTNDRWVSTPHRVINPPDTRIAQSRRLSIAYFFIPNYDTKVACVETCRSADRPAKYKPISVTAYRTERFARTAQ